MNDAIVDQLLQSGPAVSMLVVAIVYFYRRDVRNEARNEKREVEIQQRCAAEREQLVDRIRQLEDRQHHSSEETLSKVADALHFNTRALERFCDEHGSGSFRSQP